MQSVALIISILSSTLHLDAASCYAQAKHPHCMASAFRWRCYRVLRRCHSCPQVPNNEKNALLSDEAKSFMAVLAKEFPDM
jgi:hypothetical protein